MRVTTGSGKLVVWLSWLTFACMEGGPTVIVENALVDRIAPETVDGSTADLKADFGTDRTTDLGKECQPSCEGKNCGDDDGCGGKCIVDAGCDDGNPCTLDHCGEDAACAHDPVDAPCDDGNVCTVGDTCKEGKCEPGAQNLDCDDDNPCTDDWCDSADGCRHANNMADCDDGNACTLGDKCKNGECQPGTETVVCDDKNPCTDDSCDKESGCVFNPNTKPCDDGNPCTKGDQCNAGECVPGKWVKNCCNEDTDCDDGNQCTKDMCIDPGEGSSCENKPMLGAKCDDGNPDTENDMCKDTGSAIVCVGKYKVACGDGKCEFPENANASAEDPKKPAIPGDEYFCLLDCGWCGDTICKPGIENKENCPQDCNPTCGDGICQFPEQAGNKDDKETYCVIDCGGCGDLFCGYNENHEICPHDCPKDCGDGICDGANGENPTTCVNDCPAPCGDGECMTGESADMCPQDCGWCGDGMCMIKNGQESIESCPQDCAIPCGDGKCQGNESFSNCPVDCGPCGDKLCGLNESPTSCPLDCLPSCGNGKCEGLETPMNCFIDCCVQQCEGKHCGPDGCGGQCGICPDGLFCNENTGQCE